MQHSTRHGVALVPRDGPTAPRVLAPPLPVATLAAAIGLHAAPIDGPPSAPHRRPAVGALGGPPG